MTKQYKQEICPVCDKGHMIAHSDGTHKFKYQRRNYVVDGIHYAKCDNCHTSGYLPGQLTHNKLLIENFQRNLVSIISPSQILLLREKYSLTQEKASKIFGGGVNAFSRWERGIIVPAESTAKLMLLALDDEQVLIKLAKLSKIEVNIDPPNVAIQHRRRKTDTQVISVIERILPSEIYGVISPVHLAPAPSTKIIYSEFLHATLTANDYDEDVLEDNFTWQTKNLTVTRALN